MAALIKDRNTKRRAGVEFVSPVAAGVRLFTGAIACLDAQGFAVPASTATGLKFPALVLEGVDNASGVDGEASVSLSREVVGLDADSDIDRTVIGQPVYLVDDHTVSADSTGKSRAGLLVDILAGQAWVDLAR